MLPWSLLAFAATLSLTIVPSARAQAIDTPALRAPDREDPCPVRGQEALDCLSDRIESLQANRFHYFRLPRRVAIIGGATAFVFGLATAAIALSSEGLYDEYTPTAQPKRRGLIALSSIAVAGGIGALAGLTWRIVLGKTGTPFDSDFRAAKRRRQRLVKDLILQASDRGGLVGVVVAF